ncbi:hypothetical protein NW805_09160 [Synechococcus sp. W60.1]|uniref:hypothetical protein n=1 Tax=Synechococcus sp. W60.1 TaxID=2964516 RepID=UPI0039C03272
MTSRRQPTRLGGSMPQALQALGQQGDPSRTPRPLHDKAFPLPLDVRWPSLDRGYSPS